jgi:hypothetical protein
MTIQDWGITYDELEPHYDKFEYLCGTSGKAGNIRGQIRVGGNPFEGARARRRAEFLPFISSIALFVMGYVGLAISLWPNIVPHSISLWDAAAAPRSQAFLLVGTLFLLPVIVAYTAWSYWVFRGKVRAGVGYH